MIYELSSVDYIDVSGTDCLSRLWILVLSDHLNQNINLNGVDISFTTYLF